MRTVATLFTFSLIAGIVGAQETKPLQISGSVFELGGETLAQPIAGAEITLTLSGESETIAATYTDQKGEFELHPLRPGDYVIEIKKDGFNPVTGAKHDVKVTEAGSLPRLPFYFTRPSELTGRIIDEDGQPVADLEVTVQRKSILKGTKAVTAKDGSFTASDLQPGPYFVRISPPAGEREKLVTKFQEDDLKIVDQALETSFWPGGSSEPSETISVNPGGSANIGTIKVREVPYYRAHVSVASGECAPGETWEFSLLTVNGPQADAALRFSGDMPCAKDFMVSNLPPGSYWFELREVEPEPDRWALASVEVSHKNLDAALALESETQVVGRFVAANGAALPPFDNIRVTSKVENVGYSSGGSLADVDSEGKFTLKLKFPRHQIQVVGLTKQYYVKGYRFNGAPSDGSVTLSPGVGTLEIAIDDQPGSIIGAVTDGDKPATRTVVMLFTESLQQAQTPVIVDQQGGFQFTGLVPGEYRVVALPMAARIQYDSPDAIAQLAAGGAAVKVERGGTTTISVKLTDPLR